MRVHHYIKNLLVLAALACSGQLFQPAKSAAGLLGFSSFCALSSAVYIINDIRDIEKDRCHPTKRLRPLAAGIIPVNSARLLALVLIITAFLCDRALLRAQTTVLLLIYLILNLAYSFGLKNVPLLDIAILVSGFLIRILYGALATNITISNWLYLTVIALAFYFALGKRRNELNQLGTTGSRAVLSAYPLSFLNQSMGMCLTLANVFYALWSMDEKTVLFYDSKYLIFTVPIVLLITMKYSLNIEGTSDGDPVEVLLHDKTLLCLCLIYLSIMFAILYL